MSEGTGLGISISLSGKGIDSSSETLRKILDLDTLKIVTTVITIC